MRNPETTPHRWRRTALGGVLGLLLPAGVAVAGHAGTPLSPTGRSSLGTAASPAQDPAVGVKVATVPVSESGGVAKVLLEAQLVDRAGAPTDNGQVVARIAWLASGAGATLSAPGSSAGQPACSGPGVAGSGLTGTASGRSDCLLTAPAGEDVTVRAFSAATAFESPQPVVGLGAVHVTGVTSAAYDSYFVTSTGGVLAVGENPLGELGNGNTTTSSTPVPVDLPSGTGVTAVVGGGYFALALSDTGSVLSWGQDFAGQLGDGSISAFADTPRSVDLPAATKITQLAAGCNHALALTGTGQVLAWGEDFSGQLGDAARASSDVPVPVHLPAGTVVSQIAAGCNTSYALTSKGALYAWGSGAQGELGTGATLVSTSVPVPVAVRSGVTPVAISAGNSDGYLLTSAGGVLAWGSNNIGQLGSGGGASALSPKPVDLPSTVRVASVVGGGFNAFAITTGHQLYAWGGDYDGQDGVGSLRDLFEPTPVAFPAGVGVASVNGASAGGFQAVAEATDGSVFAWGGNFDDQLGYGVLTTNYFSVGLAASGAVSGWGSDSTGGFGSPSPAGSLVPTTVSSSSPYSSLSAGCSHVVASSASGSVYAWGGDSDGQAGSSPPTAIVGPVVVPLPGGQSAASVSAGCLDSLAATTSGNVYAWGANEAGELGDGSTLASSSPVRVDIPGGVSVTAISAGCSFGMALSSTGAVYTWGSNSSWQLGRGKTASGLLPGLVAGLPPIKAVAAGCDHALALATDGTLYAWGNNLDGELGTGTTASSPTPVTVRLPSGVVASAIWAGGGQSFLQATTGAVYGWGDNTTGQLATGGFFDVLRPLPVRLPAGVEVRSISTHGVTTVFLTGSGEADEAVGGNLFGQLGDGTMLTSSSPEEVAGTAGAGFASVAVGGYPNWMSLYPTLLAPASLDLTA